MFTNLNYNKEMLSSDKRSGSISWQSPSNIAIVKYWGKHGLQLPCNPSVSFTLSNAFTKTTLEWTLKNKNITDEVSFEFWFEGRRNELFEKKQVKFLNSISNIFPFLVEYNLKVSSENSFPHSAGIASSASSMSALALCLCSMEKEVLGTNISKRDFDEKSSYISRLGSGSACRSVFSRVASWGKCEQINGSSDLFATEIPNIHEKFLNFQDTILIVSGKEKEVSSSVGHGLMTGHPFATQRFAQAKYNIEKIIESLKTGDLNVFGEVLEEEALTLHSMMMTSRPSFILLKPESLEIISKVKKFREESSIPLYFTLDAGPNIHLLYPKEYVKEVISFINEEILEHLDSKRYIQDEVGLGPSLAQLL